MLSAFLSPCKIVSYSVVLLVHSNSNQQAIKVLLPIGSMSTLPAPAPYWHLDPSKYKDQICVSLAVLGIFGEVDI
jgi:hypothetical protein